MAEVIGEHKEEAEVSSRLKSVCVFCGSSLGNKESYKAAAIELGQELVLRKQSLVYGGGGIGLMGCVAQAVENGGGQVLGIIPRALLSSEVTGETVGQEVLVRDMHQRKAEMARHSDCVVALPGILGWGKEGHFAVCKIAEGFLSEDALAVVKELLPESAGGELAAVCSWPDEIRFHYHWSSALHYCDTPDFACNFNNSRDCHDSAGHRGRCVTAAINNYTMQLLTYQDSISKSQYNLTEALIFLSHFMGDIHQPLHVGFTGDLGGNSIIVRWFHRKTNLHHVWDNMIIETAVKTMYGKDLELLIEAIQRNLMDTWFNDMSSWKICANNRSDICPNKYASESIRLACKFAYRNATPGSTLTDDYFLSRLPIVEKRLAQAGVRLAAILNHIFSSELKIAEA